MTRKMKKLYKEVLYIKDCLEEYDLEVMESFVIKEIETV